MPIRLVKRNEQQAKTKEADALTKPVNQAAAPRRWVEEFKVRKAAERQRAAALFSHEAA